MIFKIPKSASPNPSWDLNNDGVVSWWEKAAVTAGATIRLCVGAWALAQVAYLGACFLVGVQWGEGWAFYKRPWFGGSILLFFGLGVILYVRRMMHPERTEKLTNADLEFQRKMRELEIEEKRIQVERMRDTTAHEPGTAFTQGDIDAMADLIMRFYYDGEKWSRAAFEERGYSQELWGLANDLLKARGIRKGGKHRLEPESYTEASQIYLDGKRRCNKHRWIHGEMIETA